MNFSGSTGTEVSYLKLRQNIVAIYLTVIKPLKIFSFIF